MSTVAVFSTIGLFLTFIADWFANQGKVSPKFLNWFWLAVAFLSFAGNYWVGNNDGAILWAFFVGLVTERVSKQ